MIKEVIFDCFGVLTQDGWTAVLKKYSTNETRASLSDLNKQVDKGLISFDSFLQQVEDITAAKKDDLLKLLVNSYYPDEEVFELIRKLKPMYKIGLISNISAPVEHYLPLAPLDLFDLQTLSYEEGISKPDPQIFLRHLAKSGVEPNQAVFIDDREANIEAANSVGITGILYQNIVQIKTELSDHGVKISK